MTSSNSDRWASPPDPSPAELSRAAQGDVEAFNRIVERYQGMTYSVAYRILGDHMDAEDAAQEAFLRCYRKLGQYRNDALFSTWLFRLVVSSALDVRRRQQRCPEPALPHDTASSGSADLDEGVSSSALLAALGELPDGYRVPVVLRDVYGLPYQEIAESLGRSTGTVRVMVHRGRASLRSLLRARGLGPAAPDPRGSD